MKLALLTLLVIGCTADNKAEDTATEADTDTDTNTDTSEGSISNDNPIASLSSGISEFTLNQVVAGETVTRRFLVHTPEDFDSSQSRPLLFAFHGNGGEPESFSGYLWDGIEQGLFIGVYPAGIEYSWNLGPEASEADDVPFIEAVLGMLTGTAGVDATKPVALGWSNP